MFNKQINITCITQKPVTYNSLTSAYTSIRNQFHDDYCCRVRKINYSVGAGSALDNKYYIDVFTKDSNQIVGYLGEYNG